MVFTKDHRWSILYIRDVLFALKGQGHDSDLGQAIQGWSRKCLEVGREDGDNADSLSGALPCGERHHDAQDNKSGDHGFVLV